MFRFLYLSHEQELDYRRLVYPRMAAENTFDRKKFAEQYKITKKALGLQWASVKYFIARFN